MPATLHNGPTVLASKPGERNPAASNERTKGIYSLFEPVATVMMKQKDYGSHLMLATELESISYTVPGVLTSLYLV